MRIVADTNTIGLLWSGPPQNLIHAARAKRITLYSSSALAAELAEVIAREQFARRVHAAKVSATELVADYMRLATLVLPAEIAPTVAGDPDDDQVLACALAARAELIVSGDKQLRNLKRYQGIPIVSTSEALALINQQIK